jgi:IgGFc binding protein
MKLRSEWSVAGGLMLAAGVVAGLCLVSRAQMQTVPIQTEELAILQGLQPVPTNTLPDGGNFWLLSQTNAPPLPFFPYANLDVDISVPVYQFGNNSFLVDDRQVVAVEAALQTLETRYGLGAGGSDGTTMMMDSGFPGLPGDGGGDTNSDYGDGGGSYGNFKPNYTTNDLWLELLAVTNSTAALAIHTAWNAPNDVYDLLYTTDIAPPSAWQRLLRTEPGQTNLTVTNAADAQGFYRLGPPDDLAANSSLGTNFWLGFPQVLHNYSVMSLYISSPVDATGAVSFPGMTTNSPVLIVTNCGHLALNGTYVLTNLSAQQQADWPNNGLDATDVGYARGTNWVDFGDGDTYLFSYDRVSSNCTFWYWKDGTNLNGTTNDWYAYQYRDTNRPPTTVCPQIAMSLAFTVAAGTVTNLNIGPSLMMEAYDQVETNGIHVATDQPVAVHGVDYSSYLSTAFTAYPTPLLGTNYCILDWPGCVDLANGSVHYSELAIVATADNTTVWITPSASANLEGHPDAYSTNLQQGQTYQVHSIGYTNDVTGTLVASTNPIAVFAGAAEANVPDTKTAAGNPLMQQQLPVDSWGTQALALSFAGRQNGASYRILAAYTNTVITITGLVVTIVNERIPPWTVTTSNEVVVVTNQAGQFYDIIVDGPVQFQASQPIQVAQFANGTSFDALPNNEGDPCEILLPPTGHYLCTNTVFTLPNDYRTGDFDENFLNLIVSQSATNSTWVDGSLVAATNYITIGTSGYFGAQITVTNSGAHTVTSSQPVGVEVYGWGQADAYGYFGGVVK